MKIAIGTDWADWHKRFANTLEYYKTQGMDLLYSIVNLDRTDWQAVIAPYDIIIWNPHYMGIRLSSHFKQKIYFMQYVLHKVVYPGYNNVWHFESKVAESFLFENFRIKTPKTFVTFDYVEACHELESVDFPIVLKKSEGASSENVKLIRDKKGMDKVLDNAFCDNLWSKARKDNSKISILFKNFTKRWFWFWIMKRYKLMNAGDGVIYWQEFIPNNTADLRITVIGDCMAYGFWRNNRPNDFRASGSGRIDYERAVPAEIVKYCLGVNQKLCFDSMCYDIIFTKDSFVITEMSYNYVDKALYNAPGYYEKNSTGELIFRDGHFWPEELWVKWILLKTGYL